MAISVTCKACGRTSQIKEKYAGRMGGCPHCHAPMMVPAAAAKLDSSFLEGVESDPTLEVDLGSTNTPSLATPLPNTSGVSLASERREAPGPSTMQDGAGSSARLPRTGPHRAAGSEPSIGFHCPSCNHRMKVRQSLAGRPTRCNRCGRAFSIPGGNREAGGDWVDLLDEELRAPSLPGAAPTGVLPRSAAGPGIPFDGNAMHLVVLVLFVGALAGGYAFDGLRGLLEGGVFVCWITVLVTAVLHRSVLAAVGSLIPLIAFAVSIAKGREWNLRLVSIAWSVLIVASMVAAVVQVTQYVANPQLAAQTAGAPGEEGAQGAAMPPGNQIPAGPRPFGPPEPAMLGGAARPAETDRAQAVISDGKPRPQPKASAALEPDEAPPEAGPEPSLPDLIEKTEPAVVRIDVKSRPKSGGEESSGSGSGFLVDDQGTIITNFHVIDSAYSALVQFHEGPQIAAAGWLAADPGHDVAVIKIDPAMAPKQVLKLATSAPRKGEKVFAIGSPIGFSFSATEGIISAVRSGNEVRQSFVQTVGVDLYSMLGYVPDATWIQTSAAISPGNSGGPLVNLHGVVVGLNTLTDRRGQNLNFAISAEDVRKVLEAAGGGVKPFHSLPSGPRRLIAHSGGGEPKTPAENERGAHRGKPFHIELPSGPRLTDVGCLLTGASVRSMFPAEVPKYLIKHPNGLASAIICHNEGTLNGALATFYEDGHCWVVCG